MIPQSLIDVLNTTMWVIVKHAYCTYPTDYRIGLTTSLCAGTILTWRAASEPWISLPVYWYTYHYQIFQVNPLTSLCPQTYSRFEVLYSRVLSKDIKAMLVVPEDVSMFASLAGERRNPSLSGLQLSLGLVDITNLCAGSVAAISLNMFEIFTA